ncbi:septum formation initiator family protein [Cellulomonas sp. zg-ZUI188]|uniref:Septum formation initiator family protein n=1 Tax=Cellulomonas fengjieae TaxID=2819978 RepID=A0ABS3SLA5_9CELL|nr:septum formation initiator family protein [Cellulomonas fengjieae]QVI66613.1 septum formation initiator family protein [Cellulomonas fengjieae]
MSAPRRPASPSAPGRRPSAPRPGASTPAANVPRGNTGGRSAPRSGATPRVGATPSSSPRPSSSRPAASRPATRGAATPPRGNPRAERVQVRVPRLFTVRALVFSCVLLLAFVLVYPTLRSYLQHRAEVDELRVQVEAARQRNADLADDVLRWEDEAFVRAQARERLSFVMPGEKAFRVVDPEIVPDTAPTAPGPASALDAGSMLPWYATVWESVEEAGKAPAPGDNGTTEPPTPPAGG